MNEPQEKTTYPITEEVVCLSMPPDEEPHVPYWKKALHKILRGFIFLFCLLSGSLQLYAGSGATLSQLSGFSRNKTEKPLLTKSFFGETEGEQIYQYTLRNSKGMMVKVINYGAAITDIITPDKNGKMGSVVLGFDSLSSYSGRMNPLMGACVGRVAGRISNKRFTLDGKEYTLTSNMHGGVLGFHKRRWEVIE